MIAMVMCAGLGTRLRPLTHYVPKPMVPVANKPVLEHTLENLRKHGVREVVINLSYRPDMIREYFRDGSDWDLRIHYSLEKEPMGTAGGVKNVEKIFRADPDSDFLVTSGDGLTDIDFGKFAAFHRAKKSMATMAISRVQERFEYGVPLTDSSGRIRKFVEKPSWSEVFSDYVNTGIYLFRKEVLDQIPAGKFYDFGHQLWPKLLKNKKPIHGYKFKEFWTDVGNVAEYRRAQKAALDGELSVNIPGRKVRKGVWIGDGAQIRPGAKVIGPCLIGKFCVIEKNATIGAYSVLGPNARVGADAEVNQSIVWPGANIGRGSRLEGSIVGFEGEVGSESCIYDGIVLEKKAKAGTDSGPK